MLADKSVNDTLGDRWTRTRPSLEAQRDPWLVRNLPQAKSATEIKVLTLGDSHQLFGPGIGYVAASRISASVAARSGNACTAMGKNLFNADRRRSVCRTRSQIRFW